MGGMATGGELALPAGAMGRLCSHASVESVRSTPPDPYAAMPPQLRLSAASLPPLASPRRGPRCPPCASAVVPPCSAAGAAARRPGLAKCAEAGARRMRLEILLVVERPLKGTEMAVSLLMDAVGSKQAIRESVLGSLPDMEDQPVIKNKGDDAWEALKAEMVDMFRPLLRNIAEFCSLRRPYDLEDYQIGMVFGAFLGCVGCYQLWKTVLPFC
ncbi:hypothetical protein ZWY2020_059549 [Hordeum vulgare]|nr:hypothetical protein ZWY2020_059549 [Hordeum vulgare]